MGGSSGGGDSTQTHIQDLPEWSKPYWEGIARAGKREAGKSYNPYQGGRLADFSNQERQAFGGVQSLYNQGEQQGLGAARSFAGNAGFTGATPGEWDTAAYQQYASPFNQVQELGAARIRDDYSRMMGDALGRSRDEGIQSGIRGGRSTLADARVARDVSREGFANLREYRAESDAEKYDSAMRAFEADRQARFQGADIQNQAASQLESLAQTQQTQALQRITALQESGMAQRDMKQAILDIAYQDFIDRRDWPREQLNWYTGLLSGTPYNTTNQTTMTSGGGSGPGTGQILGGLGVAALGAAGQIYG